LKGHHPGAFAAALFALFSVSLPVARAQSSGDARAIAEALLGADEAPSLLLFRRQFSVEGVVTGSLLDSTALAGVPAAAMLEAGTALSGGLDLDRDLKTGDHFYVRWEQEFTLNNQAVGIGRVLAVELRTAKNGVLAISRFRPLQGPPAEGEEFYLADGKIAAPAPVAWPLDRIEITSGFGLRPNPLDQPEHVPPVVASPPAASPLPSQTSGVPAAKEVYAGFSSDRDLLASPQSPGGGFAGFDTVRRDAAIGRILAERRLRAQEEARRIKAEKEAAEKEAAAPPAPSLPPPPAKPEKPELLYMHEGLDLLANLGTQVHAAADGFVTLARLDGGYGNAIQIEHTGQLTTLYGHLLRIAPDIEPGRYVRRGEVIGFVGNTGRSTGAHLHFEVRVKGKPLNPTGLTQPTQLAGFDLVRFRKKLAFEAQFRTHETRVVEAPSLAAFSPTTVPRGIQ
jgi:murein DD-endopeptidase MepM/ murein hydrolase activator NlpD